jgi:hypothetical protein
MGGNRVCIAGITDDRRIIRPEFDNAAIMEDWLFKDDKPIVKPFVRVKIDLLEHRPDPPHTEDWIIHPNHKKFERELALDERHGLLEEIASTSATDIFGIEIGHEHGLGFFIPYGQGTRSLGTLRPRLIYDFVHTIYDAKLDYRLGFRDWQNQDYRLKITDLSLRYYVDHLRIQEQMSYQQISDQITNVLKSSQVFLQLGLARGGWDQHPGFCHLQINGVYTFPDYLDGRCFADFRP